MNGLHHDPTRIQSYTGASTRCRDLICGVESGHKTYLSLPTDGAAPFVLDVIFESSMGTTAAAISSSPHSASIKSNQN